ncbi:hypothetical protein, partial [Lactobacillus paragasseri]|uniref:hypothetical protein n=1 Tax=Lactobacillus paragasseri TaxID=2107999 RepID=UPI0022E9339D
WGKPPYSDWFLAILIIRGRLSLFQYPQGINLHSQPACKGNLIEKKIGDKKLTYSSYEISQFF